MKQLACLTVTFVGACVFLLACTSLRAPDADTIRFAFGGDLAGQNVCRDAELGFPIFRQILARRPDFFVALGDMIYADNTCEAIGLYGNRQLPRETGVASSSEEFAQHWDYVRAEPAFAALLREVPYFAVWDDHEVSNDFGPTSVDGEVYSASRSVFTELFPNGTEVLYYRRSFAKQLDMFFLDTRSYRDANSAIDEAEHPKSMLGERQTAWLVDGITNSAATWKVIVTSVPLSIPTGWPAERGRDGWANFDQETGFERELTSILRAFAEQGVRDLVFITADVHFATAFRYHPFADFPGFSFLEFVTGPLNAGLFPNRAFDTSLNPERLFFHGPDSVDATKDLATALRWFNFGLIEISPDGRLRFELVDGYGTTRFVLAASPDS